MYIFLILCICTWNYTTHEKDTKHLQSHMYINTKQKLQMKFRSYCVLEKLLPSSTMVTEDWNGLDLWGDLLLFSDMSSFWTENSVASRFQALRYDIDETQEWGWVRRKMLVPENVQQLVKTWVQTQGITLNYIYIYIYIYIFFSFWKDPGNLVSF